MNSNIKTLAHIASKKNRFIIGLMSGTSLDGLDVALCKISGYGTVYEDKIREIPYCAIRRSNKKKNSGSVR